MFFKKWAKFRNIVVHHYDRVDAEIVVGILKKDLSDFTSYKDTIVGFLKSEAESGKQKKVKEKGLKVKWLIKINKLIKLIELIG